MAFRDQNCHILPASPGFPYLFWELYLLLIPKYPLPPLYLREISLLEKVSSARHLVGSWLQHPHLHLWLFSQLFQEYKKDLNRSPPFQRLSNPCKSPELPYHVHRDLISRPVSLSVSFDYPSMSRSFC